MSHGADKLVLNTAFADDPPLVQTLARRFGKQCIVASIDVKRDAAGAAKVVVDRGQRLLDDDPAGWARRARDLGAGEIFLNRSEEHTSELQSLMRISYAVFFLEKKKAPY